MVHILKDAIVKVTLTEEKQTEYSWDDGYNFIIRLFALEPDAPKYVHPKIFYSDISLDGLKDYPNYYEKESTKGLWEKAFAVIRLADGNESKKYFNSNNEMYIWAEENFSREHYLCYE